MRPEVSAAIIGAIGTVCAAALAAGVFSVLFQPARVAWVDSKSLDRTCYAVCSAQALKPVRATASDATEAYVCRAETVYDGTRVVAGNQVKGQTDCRVIAGDNNGTKKAFECLCATANVGAP